MTFYSLFMESEVIIINGIFPTCRKVAWEDLTLECSASLPQSGSGATTVEPSTGDVEYDNEEAQEGMYEFDHI